MNEKTLAKTNNLLPTSKIEVGNPKGIWDVPFLIHPQINPVYIRK